MRYPNKNTLKSCYEILAHFLIFLILSSPLIPLTHHHFDSSTFEYADDVKSSFNSAIEKCELCACIAQQHGKEFLLSYSLKLNVLLPKAIGVFTDVIAGNYSFSRPGVTNRGPPSQV